MTVPSGFSSRDEERARLGYAAMTLSDPVVWIATPLTGWRKWLWAAAHPIRARRYGFRFKEVPER